MTICLNDQKRLAPDRQYLSKTVEFLASYSVFVSMESMLILFTASILIDKEFAPALFISAFLLTFVIYNLDRLSGSREDEINNPSQLKHYRGKEKLWLAILGLLLILCFLLLITVNVFLILVFIATLVVSMLYGRGFSFIPRLKTIPIVKNLIIASTWSFIPTVISYYYVTDNYLLLFVFSFIFIKAMINPTLFDLRDVEGDRTAGVKTLPVLLGVNATYHLLLALDGLVFPWIVVAWLLGYFHPYVLALTFSAIYGVGYTVYLHKKKMRILFDLLVDGEWIPLTLVLALVT